MPEFDPKEPAWVLLVIQLLASQSSGNVTIGVIKSNYPFLASLILPYTPIKGTCGATLFTPSRLFTACHCLVKDSAVDFKYPDVELLDPEMIEVVAGSIYNDVEYYHDGVSVFVRKLKVHPKCKNSRNVIIYDYGVVEVSTPFELQNGFIEVYPLENQEKDRIRRALMKPNNIICQSMGWGATEGFSPVQMLNKVNMTLKDLEWCRRNSKSKGIEFLPEIHACAVDRDENNTVCMSDSGGPLVCGSEKYIIIGVNSLLIARRCGKDRAELVVSRLDSAMDWIKDAFVPHPTSKSSNIHPFILCLLSISLIQCLVR